MKINYVTNQTAWTQKMSIGRRKCVEHTALKSDLEVTIGRHVDCDVIWAYKTGGLDLHLVDKPKITVFNEANDATKTLQDIADTDASHCVFHHYGDYIRWVDDLKEMGITCSWQPHAGFIGVDPGYWTQRDIPLILTGAISADIYPLRYRYKTAIAHGLEGIHLPHPGYRLQDTSAVLWQYRNYTAMLGRSKVSLCCTSKYKYPLAKLYESAAAGCVVATDKPECPMFEEHMWPHCIQLDSEMSSDEITQKLRSYSDSQLMSMAEKSYKAWLDHFTVWKWSERFSCPSGEVGMIEKLKEPFHSDDIQWRIGSSGSGQRGMWCQILAYVSAQQVMERLDSVVGPENWKVDRKTESVNVKNDTVTIYQCDLSIRIDGEWVTKSDVAAGTDIETVKGGASDALKRAAVLWGVARYLYYLGNTFGECSEEKKPGYEYAKDSKSGKAFYWRKPSNYDSLLKNAFQSMCAHDQQRKTSPPAESPKGIPAGSDPPVEKPKSEKDYKYYHDAIMNKVAEGWFEKTPNAFLTAKGIVDTAYANEEISTQEYGSLNKLLGDMQS